MQVFMRNVPFATTDEQLRDVIAKIVHRPPIQPPGVPKVNFHLELFGYRRGRKPLHKGCGLLTFSSREVAQHFLTGYPRLVHSGRQIQFEESTKTLNDARVRNVRDTAWQEPQAIQKERERVRQQSAEIDLLEFSFGRRTTLDDRRESFSREAIFHGSVSCDLDGKKLAIRVKGPEESPGVSTNLQRRTDLPDPSTSFHYLVSRIISVQYTEGRLQHHILIETELPPTFLRSDPARDRTGNPIVIKQRLSSPVPERSLPPILKTLCLTFRNASDRKAFLARSQELHLPRASSIELSIDDKGFYSQDRFDKLRSSLSLLPFRLAFELHKQVYSGVLSPVDVEEILPALNEVSDLYPKFADALFRFFINELQAGELRMTMMPVHSAPQMEHQSSHQDPRRENESPRARKRRRQREKRRRDQEARRLAEEAAKPSTLIEAFRVSLRHYERVHGSLRLLDTIASAPGIYQSYHVIVTPTNLVLEGPLPDQSNALLRKFGAAQYDRFLRVSWQDEERCKLRRDQDVEITELLNGRFKPILVNGLNVAGRYYEWLGYSMSGLKENTLWFVHSPISYQGEALDAEDIRRSLGDFSRIENKPSLLGARWAQTFSTSMPSVTLGEHEIKNIDDIKAEGRGGRTNAVFTDGVSPISPALARAIWKKLQRDSRRWRPCSFQFRFGGAKGVLVEDPTLRDQGRMLCLRPSQTKFVAEGVRTLDITTASTRPLACFLNRPFIAIAEHHGVPLQSFRTLQDAAIAGVQEILTSTLHACDLFWQYGLGGSFRLPTLFRNISKLLHHDISEDPNMTGDVFRHHFLSLCLIFGANYILRDIKHRAHILIPGSYTLIGVADEWDCLAEGEIYAHVVDQRRDINEILEGRILITRSPQIHPGDIQFCRAVKRPELAHLTNVVVFSCKGERSLCSKLGGGDLDGDIYNLIRDRSLFPPKEDIGQAGEYQGMPHKETAHGGPCTISDVADFVTDFIQSDLLGYISILFLRIADLRGVDNEDCRLLATKASQAVDYPKVGHPVTMRDLPRAPDLLRPDFLSGEGADLDSEFSRYYRSEKALGELFRNVPIIDHDVRSSNSDVGEHILQVIEDLNLAIHGVDFSTVDEFEEEEGESMEEMRGMFEQYSQGLMAIAKTHSISRRPNAHLSEAELVSGTIQERYNDHRRRREAVKAMNLQTQELVNKIHHEFEAPALEQDNIPGEAEEQEESWAFLVADDDDLDNVKNTIIFRRAMAAFLVAEEQMDDRRFGAASFGIIALSAMLAVVKRVTSPHYQQRYV